jgi:hypothetical protein
VADLVAHIQQANHNERCANYLIAQSAAAFRDWAITAGFYAAVHLAEASFVGHAEIEKAWKEVTGSDPTGGKRHQFRSQIIRQYASDDVYKRYTKLSTASYHVRYLAKHDVKGTQIGPQYYSVADVAKFVKEDLPRIRVELQKAFGTRLTQ